VLDLIRALCAGQDEVEAGATKLANRRTAPFKMASIDDDLVPTAPGNSFLVAWLASR
jgi:hypothetical protein